MKREKTTEPREKMGRKGEIRRRCEEITKGEQAQGKDGWERGEKGKRGRGNGDRAGAGERGEVRIEKEKKGKR